MRSVIHLVLIFLITLICQIATAQINISGKVLDSKTKEGLPGANIYLKSNWKVGTSTKPDGSFKLSVPSLSDSLIISFIGYREKIVVPEKAEFSILLNSNQQNLEEVVVKADKLIAEEFTIQKINRLEIYKNPSAKADALLAVNTLPSSTTTDESAEVSFRGSSPQETGIFLNGVPVYNSGRFSNLNGIGTFSIFSTELIKDVQVFPGNPPLEFGSTTSGLISIQSTEAFFKKPVQSVSLTLASFGFNIRQPINSKTSLMVYSNYQPSQLFRSLNEESLEDIERFDSFDAGVHLVHKPSERTFIKFFNYSLGEDYKVRMMEPTFSGPLNQGRVMNLSILNFRYQFDHWNFSFNQAYTFSDSEIDFSQFVFDIDERDVYSSINGHYESKKVGVKSGLTYDFRTNEFNGIVPIIDYAIAPEHPSLPVSTESDLHILDGYFYLKYYLNDRVILGSGVRKNVPLNNQSTYWSAQGSASIELDKNSKLNIGGGRFNRFIFSDVGGTGLIETDQVSIDYIYDQTTTDLTFSLFGKNTNFEDRKIRSFGFEAFAKKRFWEKLTAQASYTFINSREQRGEETFDGNFDLNYFVKGGIEYQITSLFTFNTRFIFRQGTFFNQLESTIFNDDLDVFEPTFASITNRDRFNDYKTIDLSLTRLFPINENLTIIAFASLNNVFNFENTRALSFNFDYTQANPDFFNLRTVYFGVVLNFL